MNNGSKCSNKRRFNSENEARKERLFVEEEYSKKLEYTYVHYVRDGIFQQLINYD